TGDRRVAKKIATRCPSFADQNERRPVERGLAGSKHGKLRIAEGVGGRPALLEMAVEIDHQVRRLAVIDGPEAAHDAFAARVNEGAGQAGDAFAAGHPALPG